MRKAIKAHKNWYTNQQNEHTTAFDVNITTITKKHITVPLLRMHSKTDQFNVKLFVTLFKFNLKALFVTSVLLAQCLPSHFSVLILGIASIGPIIDLLCRIVHTGPRHGQGPGTVLSYCISPVSRGVLVFLKFGQFSSELTKTWSSGTTEYGV